MQFQIGDLVDIKTAGGVKPEGRYEVVAINGNRVTIRHRETREKTVVDSAGLVPFYRPSKIDFPS